MIVFIQHTHILLFAYLTQVMFLAEGEVVYYGPSARLVEYFGSIDRPVPPNTNPADFACNYAISHIHIHTCINICVQS